MFFNHLFSVHAESHIDITAFQDITCSPVNKLIKTAHCKLAINSAVMKSNTLNSCQPCFAVLM